MRESSPPTAASRSPQVGGGLDGFAHVKQIMICGVF